MLIKEWPPLSVAELIVRLQSVPDPRSTYVYLEGCDCSGLCGDVGEVRPSESYLYDLDTLDSRVEKFNAIDLLRVGSE